MSQAEFKKRLKRLMNKPENQVCSDCPERQPRWASLIVPPPGSPLGSLPIGAFSCLECSGSHRRLGVHITFVRSVTLDQWKEKEVQAMENGGNLKVNAIFEARLDPNTGIKPSQTASGPVRERFIRDKYERRKYYDPSAFQQGDSSESESDSESEEEVTARSTTSSRRQKTSPVKINAPSEAARLRAESRRNNAASRKISSTTVKSTISNPMPKAKPAPAPEMDLLDFGLPISNDNPGPMPNPPSAAPSPTLDMFKTLTVSNSSNSNNNSAPTEPKDTSVAPPPSSQPVTQESKKMTSDDILAMFNKPVPQQQNIPNVFNNNNSQMQYNANEMNMMTHQNMNGMMFNNMPNNNHTLMMNMMQNSNNMNPNMMQNSNNMNPNMMMGNSINTRMQMPTNNPPSMMGMQQNINETHLTSNTGIPKTNIQQNVPVSNGVQTMFQNGSQYQQQPMGGSPGNLNVMGGNGMSQAHFGMDSLGSTSNSNYQTDSSLDQKKNMMNGNNPQMDQFAQFNAFR